MGTILKCLSICLKNMVNVQNWTKTITKGAKEYTELKVKRGCETESAFKFVKYQMQVK